MYKRIPLIPVYSLLNSGMFLHSRLGHLVGPKTFQLKNETLITGALSSGCQFKFLDTSALQELPVEEGELSDDPKTEIWISAIWITPAKRLSGHQFVRVEISKDNNLIEPGESPDSLEISLFMDLQKTDDIPGLVDFSLIVDLQSGYISPRYNPSKTIVFGYELTAFMKQPV